MKAKEIVETYQVDLDDLTAWVLRTGQPHKLGITGWLEIDDAHVEEVIASYRKHLERRGRGPELDEEQQRLALLQREEDERVARELAEERERQAQEKRRALDSILITSGYSFEGYSITKYSGYISGDDAISMDRPSQGFWGTVRGDVGVDLLAGLARIRTNALMRLRESAYALGCNAIIGVDFDYLTLDPETATSQGGTLYLPFLFAVTANGNAVVIEKKA